MTRFRLITCSIASVFFLLSCTEILEPISLYGTTQDITTQEGQEEFEINIKSLTFKVAEKANNAPYTRQLISTGSGSKANVQNEANFLKPNFPESSSSPHYLLGVGDKLVFSQLNEYKTENVKWPNNSIVSEYLLGPGDQLNFAQSNHNTKNTSIEFSASGQLVSKGENNTLFSTSGIIGTNGNILLFGLGNILAANRTLEDVRTEVRNILIRNGLAPNFQLEIGAFKSKKAYITSYKQVADGINNNSQIIYLNNIPITLKEIALSQNISKSNKSFALIKLTRNSKEFRFTAEQLFNLAAPKIIIQDSDQIEIRVINNRSTIIETVIGSKGNILIPNLGIVSAVNRTVDDVREEISNILIEKGIKPNFQLELNEFVSKKIYFVHKNEGNKLIPLINSKNTLRQLLLEYNKTPTPANSLAVITLKRNGQVFRMTEEHILDPKTQDIWIIGEDQIEIEYLEYKSGQVFALSGAGNAEMVLINPSKRETLADILFTQKGALNNLMAKRSEVYLLRGQKPSIAYHLDAQNVSRILVAAKTELRPNDIVYVADRPIISFSRLLSEIAPLRILLRDIQSNNIP